MKYSAHAPRALVVLTALTLLAFSAAPQAFSAENENEAEYMAQLAGTWLGKLTVGGSSLRIVFNIRVENGAYAATMDSPDQGVKAIPVSKVTRVGSAVSIEVKVIGGVFSGELTGDGTKISGTWKQSGMSFPLSLAKQPTEFSGSKPDTKSAQSQPAATTPEAAPSGAESGTTDGSASDAAKGAKASDVPYSEATVRFPSMSPGVELAGTLSIPGGEGPFPAVVLVSGSGPQNRDEEIMGHKPFGVIADYLARRGIAVLRYDDRGVGDSTGDFASATTLDLAEDARGALAFLAGTGNIDSGRMGIVGHSEGGLIAAVIAGEQGRAAVQGTPAQNIVTQGSAQGPAPQGTTGPAAAFIVMLAGPGIRGDRLLLAQGEGIARASGASEKAVEEAAALNAKLYAIAMRDEHLDVKRQKLIDAFMTAAAASPEAAQYQKAEPAERAAWEARAGEQAGRVADQLLSPWVQEFLVLNPAEYLRTVRVPVLALNGTRDLQVPVEVNFTAINDALSQAGNDHYTLLRLDGLNHLFQHAQTGLPGEYGQIGETFAPEALAAIGDWILSLSR